MNDKSYSVTSDIKHAFEDNWCYEGDFFKANEKYLVAEYKATQQYGIDVQIFLAAVYTGEWFTIKYQRGQCETEITFGCAEPSFVAEVARKISKREMIIAHDAPPAEKLTPESAKKIIGTLKSIASQCGYTANDGGMEHAP